MGNFMDGRETVKRLRLTLRGAALGRSYDSLCNLFRILFFGLSSPLGLSSSSSAALSSSLSLTPPSTSLLLDLFSFTLISSGAAKIETFLALVISDSDLDF